ncbi:MAG: hypothetical protein IJ064_04815 [Bacteroidaceae bacterium]|nr:hypothetical protein [Bacteroidaceae bacterium]
MFRWEEQMQLKQLGNVPIGVEVLKGIFKDYHSPLKKVRSLEQQGVLIGLKRGLYVVSSEISGKKLSYGLIANHIYGPSYVSLHYALRHYGLIPERVYMITSVTTRHTRSFENSLACFSYRGVSKDYFPIGIRSEEEDGIAYLIATPEKALCDMIMQERYVPSQSRASLEVFFEEDMRIELDDIRQMDSRIIRACMEAGNKKNILVNLLKLIER